MPQYSYLCGDFSDTSSLKSLKMYEGLIFHSLPVYILTENKNQVRFYPFVLHENCIFIDLISLYLCYFVTNVPPWKNSPPCGVAYMVN